LIAGQVVDADSGQPVGGATVSIRASVLASSGTAIRISPVVADSQGRFYFAALPAGAYVALPDRVGFVNVPGVSAIPLKDGEHVTGVKVRLRRLGTITGTVHDDAGDPIVGTDVLVWRRTIALGQPPTLTMAARARTDDQGTYRVSGIPVGGYYVCACNRDPIPFDGHLLTTLAARPLDLLGVARRAAAVGADAARLDDTLRTFAPTFHPNTPLASRATRVALAAGE
jgi:hypothetical protein